MWTTKLSLDRISRTYQTFGLLLVVSIYSLFLFTHNNDFPLGFHPDEVKKVQFVLSERSPDFHHPLLIIQTARLANLFTDYTAHQNVVELARTTTALYGTLMVIFCFLIILTVTANKWLATVGALLLASNPIIIVHSHYLKEDIALTATTLLAMYFLLGFVKQQSQLNTLSLGFGIGLMASSHYKSVLFLLPLGIGISYLYKTQWTRRHYQLILTIGLVALTTFLLINNTILFDFMTFLKGGWHEFRHSATGHTLYIPFFNDPFFHLRKSLFEYLITMWVYLPLLFTATFMCFKKKSISLIILLITLWVQYLIIEISPLKPAPGFVRYAIPVIPFIIIISMIVINEFKISWKVSILLIIVVLGTKDFIYAHSVITNLELDNRIKLSESELSNETTYYEAYSLKNFRNSPGKKITRSIASKNADYYKSKKITHLVLSSFEYDRYINGAKLTNQSEYIYDRADRYNYLLKHYPSEKMPSLIKPIAFFYPEIIIVNLHDEFGNN